MIEAAHSAVVAAGINSVWNYVQDIRQWALLFPGCRECEVIDENNSKWVIKVGAGGLVKTVNVLVHIDAWAGPGRVDFSYKLESEPVIGSGSYSAISKGAAETEITLHVRVEGSGPMAPMWEAVSRPLLPQMAKIFAGKLKEAIEQSATGEPAQAAASTQGFSLGKWLRKLWLAIFGKAAN